MRNLTSHIHWVVPLLLSYTLRDVSFAEVGRICRVAFREPMHLCTCVREEGDDGETTHSETPSLMSYTLRYVSFTEVGNICRVPLREPMHLCTCVSHSCTQGTFPPPGGDIFLVSSIFRGHVRYFFCRKKIVLDWGDLFRGQGGKRNENGYKKNQFFSPHVRYVWYRTTKWHPWILLVFCLLLIDKARSKNKTYIWLSVWWKTKT